MGNKRGPAPLWTDQTAGFIACAGTWSRGRMAALRSVGLGGDPQWYEHGSQFARMMMQVFHVYRIDRNGDITKPDPPLWDGALEGTTAHMLKSHVQGKTPLQRWIVPSRNVTAAFCDVPGNVRWVFGFFHSHGGQVGCIGASNILFDRDRDRVIIVTIDTPNRWGETMQRTYDRCARAVRGRWIHLYSEAGWEDKMRWLGARSLPWRRQTMDQAAVNICIPDHSSVLNHPAQYLDTWDMVMRAAKEMTDG